MEEVEEEVTFSRCLPDFIVQTTDKLASSTNEHHNPMVAPAHSCFDCNICLDFAANPVVTLCGHLYCWPCIFRWLHADASGAHHCPVCKASLSVSSLVPLYSCGLKDNPHNLPAGFPERPRNHRKIVAAALASQSQQNYYSDDQINLTGVLAFAMLPWTFRNHGINSNLNQSSAIAMAAGRSPRWRQELVESWLHQLWVFLLCCAVFCLLFF